MKLFGKVSAWSTHSRHFARVDGEFGVHVVRAAGGRRVKRSDQRSRKARSRQGRR